ncbi:cell envelope-related function transcriptional attenuator common domain-containing protein [Actinopolymorpha cephalotaxi]|uniref:Cell envelope-related function transcriptional attenuator common domain-containing protein n=1 Tax=Actinopolymorpha cephalotaxi TaxID=504797 RepID=A0A1I2XVZ5_9ACTN|nr:LCP family protein [Actinopolymorpha cephalotaxi]NYH87215.1 LCP family protein required for cell wall assembly [Actinopolymorpha cephalotaxi]SFH17610.1 cell envelope-related function transcriptional attenuator common domain-containing protein [Actinopolymorpha cephalotaxi]
MSDYRTDEGLRSIRLHEEEDGPRDRRSAGHRRKSSRTKTTLLILLSLVLILGGGVALTGYLLSEKFGNQVSRVPAFSQLPEALRPKKPAKGAPGADAMNILLAGSDARTDDASGGTTGAGKGNAWERRGQRSDTIMILHITGDRKSAYLVSIPRDSWVEIPGHRPNKINAAYSFGGPPLYIQTIEKLTGLRIDHLAVIDWTGFKALTDALGGVQMTFQQETRFTSGKMYTPGTHTLSGEEALDYVRERHHLANGDFGRMQRQQNFLRALMRQTLSNGTLTNPLKLGRAMDAITNNLSVDEEFSTGEMRSLALEMKDLRQHNVTFMTAPNKGTGMEGSQSVVYLDKAKDAALWKAIRDDKVGEWLKTAGRDDVLGEKVR